MADGNRGCGHCERDAEPWFPTGHAPSSPRLSFHPWESQTQMAALFRRRGRGVSAAAVFGGGPALSPLCPRDIYWVWGPERARDFASTRRSPQFWNRSSGKRVVTWEPTGDGKKVISLADSHILLWDLQESSSQAVLASSASLEGKGQLKFTSGRWSPHHTGTQVATANDTTIRGWDTRSMSQIYCIENAHGQLVRDLDFNPNKQYYLASCGDDCKVKFWDTRNVAEPVKTLEQHSHWVWNVRYNHSHDQLVLTGSSDSRVILSNMVSISSEPFGHLVDDDDLSDQEERRPEGKSQEPPQDSVIATYEEHEDSVYAVDWSSADPWLFASLSYDGRLVINRVPRALKYHILL
ncbi:EARP and GARP complex-interacting protein 1 isoform X4 [Mustela lutreola]|uniref:EARP and GARP complex-interacting protein 1 isoform X4 n=1 Tax=Mustela lutreola TaxID=9666 RepID=UPI0027974F3F|nr:EARP and GARP complex-interacting protein 1 isoform X4 [Mustela lutreola]